MEDDDRGDVSARDASGLKFLPDAFQNVLLEHGDALVGICRPPGLIRAGRLILVKLLLAATAAAGDGPGIDIHLNTRLVR